MSPSAVDLDASYRLNPQVALCPDSFGALAYHSGNRELSFLGSPDLVEFVRRLACHASLRDALEVAELGEARQARLLSALETLADTDVIVVDT